MILDVEEGRPAALRLLGHAHSPGEAQPLRRAEEHAAVVLRLVAVAPLVVFAAAAATAAGRSAAEV